MIKIYIIKLKRKSFESEWKKMKIKRTLNEDWNKRKTKKKIRKINLQQLFKKGKQRKIIIIKCKSKKTPAVKWEEEEKITAK